MQFFDSAIKTPGRYETRDVILASVVTVLALGLLTQVILLGGYLLLLDPGYRGDYLGQLILVSQPFVAGASAGAIYRASLHLGGGYPMKAEQ